MANDLSPKVTRVRQGIILNPDGSATQQVTVDYTIGQHGPFQVTMPKSDFTADKAKAEMQKMANELRGLAG